MSDRNDRGENFLQRWWRRKQAAKTPLGGDPAALHPKASDADTAVLAPTTAERLTEVPAFDHTTLPPIESITATSDIRAFLAPGVPIELARAALRRVWVTDPAIRDFVGPADNQWDFTKPDSMPGFGALEQLTPELRRMAAHLIGDVREASELPGNANAAPELPTPATPVATADREVAKELKELLPSSGVFPTKPPPGNPGVASQENDGQSGGSRAPSRPQHGGAVPRRSYPPR